MYIFNMLYSKICGGVKIGVFALKLSLIAGARSFMDLNTFSKTEDNFFSKIPGYVIENIT